MINATVVGNVGKDGELRTVGSGKTVLNFSIASNNPRAKDQVTWVRCAMWGERASKVAQYVTKGKTVAVAGSLTTREYDGKTYVELDVQDLKLCGGDSKPAEKDDLPF